MGITNLNAGDLISKIGLALVKMKETNSLIDYFPQQGLLSVKASIHKAFTFLNAKLSPLVSPKNSSEMEY